MTRSIPTCVGLTISRPKTTEGEAVHPHVRGAHEVIAEAVEDVDGPSPRAWGSRGTGREQVASSTVHPHVRGAHTGT